MKPIKVYPENLAYWYFRLNGCFTITNFVIHPEQGRSQRTDVDIFAVRLPHRAERLNDPMQDDQVLLPTGSRTKVILAEVKKETCNLNGPWIDPQRENMQRAMQAAGPFPGEYIDDAARALYQRGVFEDDQFTMTLFCIGRKENKDIRRKFPLVPQITWDHVLDFIYNRFVLYRNQKCQHPQWDNTGKCLFRVATNSSSTEDFAHSIEITTDDKAPNQRLEATRNPRRVS